MFYVPMKKVRQIKEFFDFIDKQKYTQKTINKFSSSLGIDIIINVELHQRYRKILGKNLSLSTS